eukprot:Selendium_serpulae@DN5958_c0_g1_i1.p2
MSVAKIEPCPPVEITFDNVQVTVKVKKPGPPCKGAVDKQILFGISGVINPGDMVALMGASGAGKSTFLNCLSANQSLSDGAVTYNGVQMTSADSRRSAFIRQEDIFLGNLTVKEHLKQQIKLRTSKHTSEEKKEEKLDFLLDKMRLLNAKNSRIGNLSAGEGREASHHAGD